MYYKRHRERQCAALQEDTIMSGFLSWYNDADMPSKQADGTWIDLETGISFNQSAKEKAERQSISAKAQDARNIAKAFGGKALSGTAKQKEWAEKIRAEKLSQMDFDTAILVCDKNGLLGHSKFWIENRTKSATEIGLFIIEQKKLLASFRKLEKGTEEAFAIADKYNTLTAKWGF